VMGVADRSDIGDDMSDVEYRRKKYDQAVGLCMWRVTDHGSLAKQRFSIDEGFLNPCETPHRDTDRLPASERQDDTFRSLARTVGMFDISADGETIATSLDANKKTFVKIWETSKLLRHESTSDSEESSKNSGFGSQFANISFSPDGRYLAATTIDAKLYYWPVSKTAVVPTRPGSGKAVETMKSLSARGQALVFDPDPRDPILAIGLQDSTILLWSTKYYRDVLTIHQHTGGVLGLAFSPDGKTLASSGNDGLVVALTAQDR
jgi:WD40 repeat protein